MADTKDLRKLINEKKFVRIAGAHNGMTAKLVEKNGFDGVWASGLEISTSHAAPDANILTMSDFLDASAEMAANVSIPVISDCDTGFGNSNNVIHMVRRFEAAGVSAVCIEDKKFPKVNSFVPGRQELVPVAEFVGKIMAAKHAQQKDDFLIFARIEALIAGYGLEEALRRADTYMDAGADGIFIHSKSETPAEIAEFCGKWKKRGFLIICPTTYPSLTEKDMRKSGVNVVIYANHGIRASIKAVNDILSHINKNGIRDADAKIAGMKEVFELQGMHLMKAAEEKYLKSEIGSVKAIIPAAGSKMDDSLKGMLEDRPLGMLDINGRTLIQRNVETLNNVGIKDVNLIVGYKREMVNVEGVKLIENPDYGKRGMMYSILKGIQSPADRNVIAYADIIFDQELIGKLLRREEDIILVVDGTYKKTHVRNKELELVLAECPPSGSRRTINVRGSSRILRIGKDLHEKEAHYEFIGIASLSRKGISIFEEEYKKAEKEGVESYSFVEFIQHLIGKGHNVSAYEVAEGWMEVHNFNDYKEASAIFA